MNDYAQWLEANDRYLAAALAELRARLQRGAQRHDEAAAPSPAPLATALMEAAPAVNAPAAPKPSWLARMFGGTHGHAPLSAAELDAIEPPAPRPIVAVAPEGSAAADTGPPVDPTAGHGNTPALAILASRLGLTAFERDLLLLCIGMELDTRFPALCAQAQHDPGKPYPTYALAFAVLDAPSWDALSPERPLRYWRLLEIHQPGAQPLIGAALGADERVVNFVKGLNYLDDRLTPLLTALPPATLPPSQQALAEQLLDNLRHVPPGEPMPAVQLLGSDGVSKQAVAQTIAAAFGAQAYRLSAELLPAAVGEQETLLRLWQRESQLLPLALYLDAAEVERGDAAAALVKRFLARAGGLSFVDAREPWAGATTRALSIDVAKPTAVEQRTLWQRLLGAAAGAQPQQLAGHFDFNLNRIEQIAHVALAAVADKPEALAQTLWQGALAHTRPALDQLAQRIEPKAGWDDLKLPDSEKALLRQIADQVAQRSTVYDDWGFRARMNRGLSISALFTGESGTGKTMAAEVLARELGLSLYRIDLSAVVSKYIGETEKNLRKLFDAAEGGGAILFFDEADALFGKRSEVKDSHDRYANIEVNYLLQRLESFRGVAILATNMKGALDGAFLRRLRFVINFPFPGVAERRAIWASVFPPQAAVGALDLERLARFALTGGSIQGIALNAAFMAAQAGVQIGMPLLLDAVRGEYRKLDKPVNEADFRWLASAGGHS
ncbi:AAA family ATPase [Rhodanobacter sp. FW510-R12]|uniref:ATP-binding protein n=1 Tax=unclassified Rhodanobacter TaxID=2621553 RepID=UPI0007AA26BE|nr:MULTISPECIES: AAA family ATPase [unclassified Rhodanobacter]KZC17922.1 AAA family ATPase [Rhodanobacter sp. FW104-R8]KZC25617.1 AAA family ATPase [Rhodanobacter sp. FW510-T8]KZC32819.1 AAA family ATPase [Rhodanobacter sp. FW510-R10]